MRLRYAFSVILLLAIASLPAMAQWRWGRPHPPRTGACFYRETGFAGDYFCLKVGDRWPSLPSGFNDRISSIRVFNGARLRVFNDGNFRGISLLIDGDVDDLRRVGLPDNPYKTWNDRISSLAVFREHDEWEHRRHERDGREGREGREEHGY
jgi:hypothetical protein